MALPKSYGEIYGYFFVCSEPQSLVHVTENLKISKGSASQGIRFLKRINALHTVYLKGDRRDHYVAETRLRKIVRGLFEERIEPQFKSGFDRLSHLQKGGGGTEYASQLEILDQWGKLARELSPALDRVLRNQLSQK